MTDLVMRKRAAARAGEIGLFVESPVFEDDFANLKMGGEVQVKATTPRSLRQHKFAWALATKVAEACDWLETKDDAMEYLLIEAKHFRRIYDPLRKIAHLRPKPTNWGAMDGSAYTALLKRMTHVVTHHIVPGLEESTLKAEIENMIGPDFPTHHEPEPPKPQRRSRSAARKPAAPAGEDVAQGGDAQGEASEEGVSSVAPADSPPPESRPEGPTNEEEYIRAARAWIAKQTSNHEDARTYFDGDYHVELRRKCGVSIGVRNMLRRELAAKYEGKADGQEGKAG